MLQGYNTKRPDKENYESFVSRLTKGLEKLDIKGMGLMFWGSYIRDDVQYGRSDIDSTWMFPGSVVIDKKVMHACSEVLCDAQKGNDVPFDDVTICDPMTMNDGRFIPYGPDFGKYFKENVEIVVGDDPRSYFQYHNFKTSMLHNISFNLRSLRTGILFSEYNKYLREEGIDEEGLVKSFDSNFKKVSRMSKMVCDLYDEQIQYNRFSGLERAKEYFPEVNTGMFELIKDCYTNLSVLDGIRNGDSDMMIRLMEMSTTCIEELIRAYIRRVPINCENNIVFEE